MATRAKAAAVAVQVPQTREDCAAMIRALGDAQRVLQRRVGAMNDAIAEITDQAAPEIEAQKKAVESLVQGIQTYAEANRAALTEGNKVKFANLVTGEVSWRQRPPSCAVRGAEAVVETLKRLGLGRFVRTKEEVNKEAILNEPAAVAGVAGLTIVSGVEDFIVTPFEQEVGVA
ncbi:MAG: host-nuclease inhibitor Gam family protein [Rhodocyclaceae bacterium]|nr:host-nuclease inhibitor Gam family protein [Rhodocyclaceae bacterium]